jgi:cell division protein FtsL
MAAVLLVLLVASALGVIHATHQSRTLFSQLEALESRRDAYNAQWSQLQLEQSTWATHARIEGIAENQLDMVQPSMERIVIMRQ